MYLRQLTVFLENREGRLERVTQILAENQINIVCLSLADTSEYGVLRLVVSDPDRAKAVLKEAGFSSKLTDILGVKLEQAYGALNQLLKVISQENINVEYMYTLNSSKNAGSMILKVSDIEKGYEAVKKAGLELVNPEDIYAM